MALFVEISKYNIHKFISEYFKSSQTMNLSEIGVGNMWISKVKVDNFRLLKSFELDLEKELSLAIGKNNCGKTSLLSIFDKFIGSKTNTNPFSYDDFNIDFQKELKTIVESNEEVQYLNRGISLKIFIKYDETDNLSNSAN